MCHLQVPAEGFGVQSPCLLALPVHTSLNGEIDLFVP